MIKHETKFRARYAETDRMGYVYYGNYAAWFEVGRVELLRTLGTNYSDLEDQGVLLPVRDLEVRYLRPVRYDQHVTLLTKLVSMPDSRMFFEYDIYSEEGKLMTSAKTTLVFVEKKTGRPMAIPDHLAELLRQRFSAS